MHVHMVWFESYNCIQSPGVSRPVHRIVLPTLSRLPSSLNDYMQLDLTKTSRSVSLASSLQAEKHVR
jgi:hypothetical protein